LILITRGIVERSADEPAIGRGAAASGILAIGDPLGGFPICGRLSVLLLPSARRRSSVG
jgi:hypothetical protein